MRLTNLSINPSYFCNFRCSFCYLTGTQLANKEALALQTLQLRLKELKLNNRLLGRVDLYGGEVGLLKSSYLESMADVLTEAGCRKINIITNLSVINPFFLKDIVYLTVSYDFEAREKHELVFQNMCKLERPFSVLVLASPKVLLMNIDSMISFFNSLSLIQSVEIKPYSSNQSNQYIVGFNEYEEFVKKWIQSSVPKKFQFVNEDLILDSLDQIRNAYSDDHLYLTPAGQWAVLDFDKDDHEYFQVLDKISDYDEWTQVERTMVAENYFCSKCKYLGRCLTEHYRNVRSVEQSCSGFKYLLEWAENYYGEAPQEQNSLL